MPEINSIKYLRNNKSLSVNEIAKIHNINWSTAKKSANNDQISQEPNRKRTVMMYKEQRDQIVSDWLMEDYALKKKAQRNNTILFN